MTRSRPFRFYWVLALLVAQPLVVPSLFAQEAAIGGYLTPAALAARWELLDQQSDRVAVTSLGTTLGGRPIPLLTISEGESEKKPAILVMGSVEAANLMGAELALRIAERIAGTDAAQASGGLKQLLTEYTIFVIPQPNPDGSAACFERPFHAVQVNGQPTDDDRDHAMDEDPSEDLNGDGWITQLRIADAGGDWLPHPNDARVLIKADPAKNERGLYKLYTEGVDNDGDEQWNEDGPGGVDFNRNFTFEYPSFQPGAGPNAVSEIETRAVADFVFDHPRIAVIFSFSSQDNLFHPWKPDANREGQRIKTTVRAEDAPALDFMAEAYRKLHGGQNAPTAAAGAGTFAHWAYFHAGRWSLSTRGWWPGKVEPAVKVEAATDGAAATVKLDERAADELNLLRWLDAEKIDGFVPWVPVSLVGRPDLKAEVGGFKLLVTTNAPAKELDALAQKQVDFLSRVAELMPRVVIRGTKVEPLGAGLTRLTVTVANDGFLPTVCDMGRIARTMPPLQIALELPQETALVTGTMRGRWERLAGGGAQVERVWVIRNLSGQPQTVDVQVGSPAVGSARTMVTIQ